MKKFFNLTVYFLILFGIAGHPASILAHCKEHKHCHSSTFISLYALGQQTILPGDPILFNAVSAQNGAIVWPGSNNGEIIVSEEGTYRITFGVQPIFNARISLSVNSVSVPGGTLSIDLSIPFSGLALDIALPANSTISLRNTGAGSMTLTSAGPDPDATIAFIEIHRVL